MSDAENQHPAALAGVAQDKPLENKSNSFRVGTPSNETGSHDILVDWDGPNDPENPRNWSLARKAAATAVVSLFTLVSPVSSSMMAPATEQIAQDLNITASFEVAMTVSIFLLAYAIGPLFLAPISEFYGRARVLIICNAVYVAWNLGCGFAQTKEQLLAFRFLAGLGGSAPLAIGGGVLADLFAPESRGQAMALYTLGPLLGPATGPVAGAWVAERSTWRWVFWSTSIVGGVVQVLGFVYLRETYAPVLLERKAQKIMKSMDPEKQGAYHIKTPFQTQRPNWKTIFAMALIRPFSLFALEPILQVFGLYLAIMYGIMFILLTTIPTIFAETYHESVGIAGLHYLALAIGTLLCAQLNGPALDRSYRYFTQRNGGNGRPEYRLPTLFVGSFVLPAGLLLVGWGAQKELHWIVVDIGLALVGGGGIVNMIVCQTYVIDSFSLHAASALAAVSCLRSFAGFGFPLFAPALYKALGYGKGDTMLAALAAAVGCPTPLILWMYGERIRGWSKNATKTKATG